MNNISKSILLFLVLLTTFLVTFCNKPDDGPAPQDRTALLIAKKWQLTGLSIDPAYDTVYLGTHYYITNIYDIEAITPTCKKDNTYKFNPDSSLVLSEGTVVCNPSEAATGKWYFSKDQTELTTIISDSVNTYKIVELNSSSLKTTNSLVYKDKTYTAYSTFTPKL